MCAVPNPDMQDVTLAARSLRGDDVAVFAKSDWNEALKKRSLDLPDRAVFLGDDAFLLRSDLLKPFPRCGL